MGEPKFTKGPWRESSLLPWVVEAEGAIEIADVAAGPSLNAKANTHLIAAAPDLYEALDACLGLILNQEMQDGFESQQGHLARAALAKARGETP